MKFIPVFLLFSFQLFAQKQDSAAVVRVVDSLITLSRNTLEKDNDAALRIAEVAKQVAEKGLGEASLIYAKALFHLGRVYHSFPDYQNAEFYYLKSIELRGNILGKEHIVYAMSLNNLAALYWQLGKYEKSEPLYLEAKRIYEKTAGKENPNYVRCLSNLAVLYADMGKYEESIQVSSESVKAWEKLVGKRHPDYASSLITLAMPYALMGQYNKAQPLYTEAKNIYEEVFGKKNGDYSMAVYNLADGYRMLGQYDKAELLYIEAISIDKELLGDTDPAFVKTLGGLADLYLAIGEYSKAELLYLKIKNSREKVLGKEHPDYARCLMALGELYIRRMQFEKAESYLIESMNIREKILGKEHIDYARNLNYLANLYAQKMEYDKARQFYLQTKSIQEKISGNTPFDYAWTISNLGTLYLNLGQPDSSEALYLEALEIRAKAIGADHPDNCVIFNNLSEVYRISNRPAQATSRYLEAASFRQKLLQRAATHLSENELINVAKQHEEANHRFFSFALEHTPAYPHIARALWDNILVYRAAGLEVRLLLDKAIAAAPADSLRDLHSQWCDYLRRIVAEEINPLAEQKNLMVLKERAEILEKELRRSLPGFAAALQQVNWQNIRDALRPGEVAVEFVSFRYYESYPTDSTFYAALLLRHDSEAPAFIPLCEEKQLKAILGPGAPGANEDSRPYFSKVYGRPDLYRLLWQPIENQLKGDSVIYYAPAGELHKINLEALHNAQLVPLASRFRLVRLGSTRQIAVPRHPAAAPGQTPTAIVYGGIRYDADSLSLSGAIAPFKMDSSTGKGISQRYEWVFPADSLLSGTDETKGFSRRRNGSDSDAFQPLPQTLMEAQNVSGLLRKKGFQTDLRTGFGANEEHFKQIGKSVPAPRVLHIATHGFFFPNPAKDKRPGQPFGNSDMVPFKIHEQPMMRSGLVLAGANRMWQKRRPFAGMEDGILTAYEASHLNLAGTELVVLSACETNLGDIAGSEGVYGLQRALKIAGAQHLIMSLWEVPDAQTQVLFSAFYQNWLEKGMEIPEAFRAAQQLVRAKEPNPYFWAGFVLVE